MYAQSRKAGLTAALGLFCLMAGGGAGASPLAVTNTFQANTPATAASVNQNFADVEDAVNDNHDRIESIEQRLLPLEASANGQSVMVDCTGDSAALKNTVLTPNTTYVLTGICDGQIVVGAGLGTINIEGDGSGLKDDGITLPAGETDGDTVFAAIYAVDGVRLNLSNLTINAASYNAVSDLYIGTVGSYRGAHVYLDTVDVVGGDEGLGAYNGGTFSVDTNVAITGFRNAGIKASRASVVRVFGSVTVTGASAQEGSNSEGMLAIDGGVISASGGGTVSPASGTGLSAALDTAAAISAFRNGTIDVTGMTVNGTVWSGESAAVNLRNVTQAGGAIDAYRNAVIRVRSSDVTGNAGDPIYAGVFSMIRMDDTNIGNASGTEFIGLYNFGIIDLRGSTNANGRQINCTELREVRIRSSVTGATNINC